MRNYFVMILLASLGTGCAGSAGSHKLISAAHGSTQSIAKYTDLLVIVKPVEQANIQPVDAERIAGQIADSVKEAAPDRFKTINAAPPPANALQATVAIKRYDKGSSGARLLLAGLGQIHIDADIMLSDTTSRQQLAKHEVTKTFGWGGFYGATTGIRDVEEGFCKAVADSILEKD